MMKIILILDKSQRRDLYKFNFVFTSKFEHCKEIQPVHPKGDQSRVFIGRIDAEAETPILWPLHVKS